MTDHDLPDLLDRLAERHAVGPPPTGAMLAEASRSRRRRTGLMALGAAAAVAAVAVAGVVLPRVPDGRQPGVPAPSTSSPTGSDVVVPAGMRLVGVGRVGILVPEDFATNALRCGTATAETVIVDVGVVELCLYIGPEVHDSVWIREGGYQNMFTPDRDVEIGGAEARRQDTACRTYPIDNMHPQGETRTTCTGVVYFPVDDIYFAAESDTAAGVNAMLAGVVVLGPDQIGVPGTATALYSFEDVPDQAESGEFYVRQLQALGFRVDVVEELVRGTRAGLLRRVDPMPGTVLAPGDAVAVTVTAAANNPADEVAVSVNSVGPGDSMDYRGRSDEQIRAGATIHLTVGSRIWALAGGHRSGTLAGELDGDALAESTWDQDPNKGRSWVAVEPGTTVITLTITADGRPVRLGSVTVIVD